MCIQIYIYMCMSNNLNLKGTGMCAAIEIAGDLNCLFFRYCVCSFTRRVQDAKSKRNRHYMTNNEETAQCP